MSADRSWEDKTVPHPDEDEFIRATVDLQLRYDELSFDELQRGFESIAASFADRLQRQSRWRDVLTVRRVIAEHVLTAGMVKDLPVVDCERLLFEVFLFGWPGVEQKTLKLFAFGRYAADHDHPHVMRRYIEPLRVEIHAEQERTNAPWCADYLARLDELLAS